MTNDSVQTFDVKCRSGRTFTMKVPTGLEQVNADRAAGDMNAAASFRVAVALVAIDGAKLDPAKDDLLLEARLQDVTASESDQLLRALGEHYKDAPKRVFELRELNGLEQANADRAARDTLAIPSFRAIAAVTKVDGQAVPRFKKPEDLMARLAEVSGPELNALVGNYSANFQLTGEDLGNGFAPDDSSQAS